MTHPNSIMKDFGKAFSSSKKRKTFFPKMIAEKILSFDPGKSDFVAVGTTKPLEPSITGLTWEEVQALALHVTKGRVLKKRLRGRGHITTFS